MTPITISMIFRIENSVCSGNQRAIRSVQIAKPAYNANIVAPRAKEWDISDDNGSTVFTTNIGAQTSEKLNNDKTAAINANSNNLVSLGCIFTQIPRLLTGFLG
ncbi:hypothetical protein BY996DRAFT_6417189 [Phakopsora pachyrhizi]|nr:hypothetical protein BY996DRAFT_6417189 [Phakopsora pachyrhizi]